MKYNKIIFEITLLVAILSLMFFLIFSLCENIHIDTIAQLLCGIFGSAVSISITSICGYFIDRSRTINNINQFYNSCNLVRIAYSSNSYVEKDNGIGFLEKDCRHIFTILLDNSFLLEKELCIFKMGCFSNCEKNKLKQVIEKIDNLRIKIHKIIPSKIDDKHFKEIFKENGNVLNEVLAWIQSQNKKIKTYNSP